VQVGTFIATTMLCANILYKQSLVFK